MFVREEEERQSRHNQKPEEMSSKGFDHREARMVILLCVVGEGIRLMVYTAVSAASPQKHLGREAEMRKVRTTSRM